MNIRFAFLGCIASYLAISAPQSSPAQMERFIPPVGGDTEVWRLTNKPGQRNWANYHNSEAWSPDGRYVCYEVSGKRGEVHLYDLLADKDILVDAGSGPRWANNNIWLFYLRRTAEGKGNDVIRLNVSTGEKVRIASSLEDIGETDSEDRWLFGRNAKGIVRMLIEPDARVEDISSGGALGSFMIPNPQHPRVMFRGDSRDSKGFDMPYAPTRVWSDLEGNDVVSASPMIQRCHQAWSGDGTYHLHGNSQMRGRLWNEPFPSNLHYIAAIDCHDICSCGKSGRWVIGSGNLWPMPVADLRSGDGRYFLKAALSFIHDSRKFSYSGGSGLHDNDAKGSPDGTKVVLSCNYDLMEGPVTWISADVPDPDANRIPVESTEGFPLSGMLSVQNEIIGYQRKTPTSFEGLTRSMLDTMPCTGSMLEDLSPERRDLYVKRPNNDIQFDRSTAETLQPYLNRPFYLTKGIVVTSFDARIVPEKNREVSLIPARYTRGNFPGDYDSILKWQRQTDVYVAVIRRPDRPFLRVVAGECELIPGENHWETRGYHLLRDGVRITKDPDAPGTLFALPGPGEYTAIAVEWSGLESEKCSPLKVTGAGKMRVLRDKPGDFQWSSDRWLVDGKEVNAKAGKASEQAVREIVHRIEGVIHREWYTWGHIDRRFDLNNGGNATRRLYYQGGVLLRREYHDRWEDHLSTEWFDADGYITEAVRYQKVDGAEREIGHWWYEKGMPVKLIGSEGHTNVAFPGIYTKEGDNWVWHPMPEKK